MPEMDAPRALVFRPLVKGSEAPGTRLGSFGSKEKLRIAGFFASLPFLTYLCNKRLKQELLVRSLKPSIHCIQL